MPAKKAAKKAAKTRRPRAAKAPSIPVLSNTETWFCHRYIELGSVKDAAESLGLSEAEGQGLFSRPQVRKYLDSYQTLFIEKMAEARVATLMRKGINRDSIADRYMLLASMPPERTKGSIDGQVDALRAVTELLGIKFDPAKLPGILAAMTEDELKGYEAGSKQ